MGKVQSSKTIIQKALYLQKLEEEFTLIKINNSFKLESSYFGSLSSSGNRNIPPAELGFIKRVRNHIMKEAIYENFIEKLYYPKDIQYVAVNYREVGTEIHNLIEIDIDEAYFKTAKILNVIDDKIYQEGRKESGKISKLGRLIALGTLARKEDRYHFKGRQLRKETVRSTLTENIWYSICKRVSDVMYEAKKIAGDEFILYWVDGIYVVNDPEKVKLIIELFKSFGYDVKIKSNLSVKYTSDQILVTDNNEKVTRPFFIPKQNQNKQYYTDERLKEIALEFSEYGILDDLND